MKICTLCTASFHCTTKDEDFYQRVSPQFDGKVIPIPSPTLCPSCRLERRLAYRPEFYYYSRPCSACSKNTVSVYPPTHPTPSYCYACWWSEGWSAEKYGRAIDFSRPFFEQYRELASVVPQLGLMNDNGAQSENCEYTYDFAYSKNCYLVTATWHSENSMYSTQINRTREVFDSFFVVNQSELVYESLFCDGIYSCSFLAHSSGCSNVHFGYDLKGCNDCIGCVGLRHARNCILNVQYTKEEYEKRLADLRLDTYSGQQAFAQTYEQFRLQHPHKAYHQTQCEDSLGNALIECKEFEGFLVSRGQYSRFAWCGDAITNCYDVINTGLPQWCYEGITPDESYQTHFSIYCWKCKNVLYSNNCHASEHLFGCIGLKRRTHCILNRAYTKHEYELLARRLAHHMQETGEWGELFPMQHSPFYFNETRAIDVFPQSQEHVLARGLTWSPPRQQQVGGSQMFPECVDAVTDQDIAQPFSCATCSRPFKVMKLELAFYKKMRLPVPHHCPHCRRNARFARFPSTGKMYHRVCNRCNNEVSSSFSPERKEKILCEVCSLQQSA
jgi:hypothetical protein